MDASVEASPRVEDRGTLPRLIGFGVLAFAVCFAVRLSTLGDLAFWLDEVVTSDVAGKGWSELSGDRLKRGHSPVYFGLIKILGLGGASEFMLRAVGCEWVYRHLQVNGRRPQPLRSAQGAAKLRAA